VSAIAKVLSCGSVGWVIRARPARVVSGAAVKHRAVT
jgi:hypothetical protein